MTDARNTFLRASAFCAVAGPVLLLVSDLLHIFFGIKFEWTIGMWAAAMLIIPAIFGFTYLLASNGSRIAYFGGALAFFGVVAAASMQVLFRVHAVLEESGQTQALTLLKSTFKLIASTQMIGLAWPIGVILLAIAYFRNGKSNFIIPAMLIVGAVAFPIGRVAEVNAAVVVSGICFVMAFGLISRELLSAANRRA